MFEQMIAKFLAKLPSTHDPVAITLFAVGMIGEFVFLMRFVVQWIASERQKKTVVPMVFWRLSLIGTFMVLAYAIYQMDPVFMLAYSLNMVIYVRNLTIARNSPANEAVAEKTSE